MVELGPPTQNQTQKHIKDGLLKQSPKIRLWVKTKVRKSDFGSKVIDDHSERKDIPKSENLTMAETCIARPKFDNPTVRKPNRINNTNSLNNTNIYKGDVKKIYKEKRLKTIGSSSIITKGNSQPYCFTSRRKTFMAINTNQKPDKYEPIKAVVPIMKGF